MFSTAAVENEFKVNFLGPVLAAAPDPLFAAR